MLFVYGPEQEYDNSSLDNHHGELERIIYLIIRKPQEIWEVIIPLPGCYHGNPTSQFTVHPVGDLPYL